MTNYNTPLYVSNQNREAGKFAAKDYGQKELRSMRLSNEAWELLGEKAASEGRSRTDLIEELARGKADEQTIILKALKAFIERQEGDYGSNPAQKGKSFSTSTRDWSFLNKFTKLIENEPWELGIGE
ncbi:hypothetical protein [uncultured Nostoc sp.]|uniref:hypothetical protein n=1 Tax=uncultured Nostoc sp. TaxID=340711 RepID=UPI0035CA06C1